MSWQSERARVASLSRSRQPDDPALIAARQALRAERLAHHVTQTMAENPPLTAEQRRRIAALIEGGAQ